MESDDTIVLLLERCVTGTGLTQQLADLLDLDCDRLLLWLFARCEIESPNWPSGSRPCARLSALVTC